MENKHNRKAWFRGLKKFMKLFIKKSEFTYLGEQELGNYGIVLSNHVGTKAPLAFELYGPKNIRFWGAHQMNSGLISLYKYQTKVYYHEKKHWNLFLARLFCLIASPLTYLFYKGLRLISVFNDYRLKQTLEESFEAIKNNQNIIIFPEDSTKGYLDQLEGFHAGYYLLGNLCLKRGIDVPVYVAYYQKQNKRYVIDKPIMWSEIIKDGKSKQEVSKMLCDRCNALGKMDFENTEEQKEAE